MKVYKDVTLTNSQTCLVSQPQVTDPVLIYCNSDSLHPSLEISGLSPRLLPISTKDQGSFTTFMNPDKAYALTVSLFLKPRLLSFILDSPFWRDLTTFHLKADFHILGDGSLFLSETVGHRRVGNVPQRREQEPGLCMEWMNHKHVWTM